MRLTTGFDDWLDSQLKVIPLIFKWLGIGLLLLAIIGGLFYAVLG